ncbi:uncharacterized protein [Watersipora subatra]
MEQEMDNFQKTDEHEPIINLTQEYGSTLPWTLRNRRWISEETEELIQQAQGQHPNSVCRVCKAVLSTFIRLKVHAQQHYVNFFCPCGMHSYTRDIVSKHQKYSNCYYGKLYAVDKENYPAFYEAIKMYIESETDKAKLSAGFPPCRPSRRNLAKGIQKYALRPLSVKLEPIPISADTLDTRKNESSNSLVEASSELGQNDGNGLSCLNPNLTDESHGSSQETAEKCPSVNEPELGGSGVSDSLTSSAIQLASDKASCHSPRHFSESSIRENSIDSAEPTTTKLRKVEDGMSSTGNTTKEGETDILQGADMHATKPTIDLTLQNASILPPDLDKLMWITQETEQLIQQTCGQSPNSVCLLCKAVLANFARLKVHAQQHYVNFFCLCGVHSYVRDNVCKHQRRANCFFGRIYVVDKENYPAFYETVKIYIQNETINIKLSTGFPSCRQTQLNPIQAKQVFRMRPSSLRSMGPVRVALKLKNRAGYRLTGLRRHHEDKTRERHQGNSEEMALRMPSLASGDALVPPERTSTGHFLLDRCSDNSVDFIEPMAKLKQIEDKMIGIGKGLRKFRSLVEQMEDEFQDVQTELRHYREGLSNNK